ncbi:hypothetical protein I5420_07970 [Citrobacter koseri]|uniref:hypothetical protein n=1 Tax=Citrobacter TaxID=544 RepID=UPI0007643A50|nr:MULTISPECIES: hypothetical protein [Citrobacter]OFV07282.1 hypothetical protein HMPREF3126_21370 [Salmonella sp. HMSC13B08]EJK7980004.1 hypothetical protein [Citrobacter koseri]MBJ8748622.1 hypothetical protein [Citrobacter koseri]MBJ8772823.1 hypothetical protein [Citrobacter koseri]MBJ8827903.1 hypothetical protein [Citrobacter koseri]
MTTYNTNEPLGSASAKVLYDNAQNFDHLSNDRVNETWDDRFGVPRLTWHGMEVKHSEQMDSFENEFNNFLVNSGYQFLGDYEDGPLTFSARNQYTRYEGQYWRLNTETDVPFTTTGTDATSWELDVTHFSLIDGDTLRQEITNGTLPYGEDTIGNIFGRTLKYFGAVGDGETDDTAALLLADEWSISTGRPVYVRAGEYKILNAEIGGHYIFDSGAWIVNETLGATDNILISRNSLKLHGLNARVGCIAWPTSGNYGNALLIGGYYQPADDSGLVSDVEVYDFTIIGTTTAFSGQAMEGLGNIENVKVKRGKCIGQGTGMLFHWGGDVDLSNPHTGTVTYSHHPRNIEVEDVQFLSADGVTPRAIGLYFSACYNVKANNIYGERCPALISAKPGDVYEQVAVARDKGKVHTGIDIRNCHSRLPPDTNSAMIAITGVPDTYRTTETRLSALDPSSPSDINAENITVDLGTAAYTNPMILVRGAKNVKGSFNVVGGKNTVNPWALIDYTVKSKIRVSGSCPGGVSGRGYSSSVSDHAQHCDESVTYSSSMVGFKLQTFTQTGITLQSAVSVGNTSVSVQSTADAIIFYGAMLYSGAAYIGKVTRTTWLTAGVTNTIPVTKSSNAVSSGSAITSYLTSEGLKVTGTISGFMYNIQSTNTWGIDFAVNIERGYRGGILCDGTYCRSAKFSGSYDGVGWEDGAAVNVNIHVTATTVRNVTINGCRFDADETNPTIDNHVLFSTTDHAGVIISENTGTNPSAVAFSIGNSTVAEAYSMQQIFGNHINGIQAPVATATGLYVGGYYRGAVRNNAVPTAGYWNVGDKLDRVTIVAGGQEGWVCSAAGSPGTWVGYGVVASS